MNLTSTTYEVFFLMTSSEYYHQSVVLTGKLAITDFTVAQGAIALAIANYGSAWNMWPFKANEGTSTNFIAL